jgi:hypothetical protein
MWRLRNLILVQTLSPIFNANQKVNNRWNGVFHPIGLVFQEYPNILIKSWLYPLDI